MSPGESGPILAGAVEKSGHRVTVTGPGGIDNPVGAKPKQMPSYDQAMAADTECGGIVMKSPPPGIFQDFFQPLAELIKYPCLPKPGVKQ